MLVPTLSGLPVIFILVYGRDKTIAPTFETATADDILKPFQATTLTVRPRPLSVLLHVASPGPFSFTETVATIARHLRADASPGRLARQGRRARNRRSLIFRVDIAI
ncbi:MAG: hypothetical protein F4128_05455 [Gammaproteobacteria bacterium]|nr:hypothetical protein [Gammaproteobacteria bacterium]